VPSTQTIFLAHTKAIMKSTRLRICVLALATLAACKGGGETTAPVTESLSAPSAAAPATLTSQTICSDPSTTELSYDGESWIPAFRAFPTDDQYAPYGTAAPGSVWVGPFPMSGITNQTEPGTYFFRTTFTLPEDVKNARLAGVVHADNQATFYLNGEQFFQQQPPIAYSSFQDPIDPFDTRRDLVDGLNVVRVQLVNGGANPSTTALDFCYTVSYMLSPDGGNGADGGCPAAPSIAARYLQSLGLMPTSAAGRNLVALVADHMTQGARFEGYDKCDLGYAPAVVAFLNARLP
jgi:hypothetical protein